MKGNKRKVKKRPSGVRRKSLRAKKAALSAKAKRRPANAHSAAPAEKFLCLKTEDVKALYAVSGAIASVHSPKKVAELMVRKVTEMMRADAAIIRIRDRGRGRFLLAASHGLSNIDYYIREGGELIALYISRIGKGIRIPDIKTDRQIRYSQIAKKDGWRSLISMPLFESGYVMGTIEVYKRQPDYFTMADEQLMALFACQAAVAIRNTLLFEEARNNYVNTMRIMATIIDAKDSYIGDHSERVMNYAIEIAKMLGLSDRQFEIVRYASFLHDIGKIGMETTILRKAGPLNSAEWEQLTMHPKIGADIVSNIGFLTNVVPTILHHHARFNGGGYPDTSIKGEDIPLEARILTVADSFEAMVSDRPYRSALSIDEAIKELRLNSGTQFDPHIVSVFLEVLQDVPVHKLSNGALSEKIVV